MKKITFLFLAVILWSITTTTNFLDEQLKYTRVKEAFASKNEKLKKQLTQKQLTLKDINLLYVAYKQEDELEVYIKSKKDTRYQKLTTYSICSKSGVLGPKRKQGDEQVPEGFYYIDRFNPTSSYYLSLGINYPNQSDKLKSNAKNLGGDIFIHGYCVTIGCLPMTNDIIQEIYLLSVYAKNNNQQRIPVYIFPFKMNDENFNKYISNYKNNIELVSFWKNLKIGHNKFHETKSELSVKFDSKGNYIF